MVVHEDGIYDTFLFMLMPPFSSSLPFVYWYMKNVYLLSSPSDIKPMSKVDDNKTGTGWFATIDSVLFGSTVTLGKIQFRTTAITTSANTLRQVVIEWERRDHDANVTQQETAPVTFRERVSDFDLTNNSPKLVMNINFRRR